VQPLTPEELKAQILINKNEAKLSPKLQKFVNTLQDYLLEKVRKSLLQCTCSEYLNSNECDIILNEMKQYDAFVETKVDNRGFAKTKVTLMIRLGISDAHPHDDWSRRLINGYNNAASVHIGLIQQAILNAIKQKNVKAHWVMESLNHHDNLKQQVYDHFVAVGETGFVERNGDTLVFDFTKIRR